MANAIRFGFVKKQGIKFECALCKHFPTLMNIRSCNRKKCISKSTSQDSTHLYIVALDHKKKKILSFLRYVVFVHLWLNCFIHQYPESCQTQRPHIFNLHWHATHIYVSSQAVSQYYSNCTVTSQILLFHVIIRILTLQSNAVS